MGWVPGEGGLGGAEALRGSRGCASRSPPAGDAVYLFVALPALLPDVERLSAGG